MVTFLLLVLISGVIKLVYCSPPEKCSEGDVFRDREDCGVFYECDNGHPVKKACSPGTVFNAEGGYCDWPYNVNCENEPHQHDKGGGEWNGNANLRDSGWDEHW